MKSCPFKTKLLDFMYGELSKDQMNQFQQHLDKCPECTENVDRYIGTMDLLSFRVRPSPKKQLLTDYHRKLKKLYNQDSLIDRLLQFIFIKPPISVRFAGVMIIFLIGILIGKYGIKSTITFLDSPQAVVETNLLNNYLFETELLLLGISNIESTNDLKLLIKETNCASLLQKTQVLKGKAEQEQNIQLANLLNQLEFILLELANLEDSAYDEELNFVKDYINEGYLFVELKTLNL